MTTPLSHAVRLLRPLVGRNGEVRSLPVSEVRSILALTTVRANEVVEELEAVGFIIREDGEIHPTAAAVELGQQIASSARKLQDLELAPRGPYWTYVPKEVDLTG